MYSVFGDTRLARAAVAQMFVEAGAAARSQTLTSGGGPMGAPAIFAVEGALIGRVPAARVDGTLVLPNDEQLKVPASAFPEGRVLAPGDVFADGVDGLDRTIVTAHLDALGVLWTCVVRREF